MQRSSGDAGSAWALEGKPELAQAECDRIGARHLADWFAQGLEAAAGGVALRIGRREWTYPELHATALRLAGAICATGNGRRPVGVLAARSIECYAGILAATYARAPVVPLNSSFPAERTVAMARAAGIRVVVADLAGARVLPAMAEALPALTVIRMDPDLAVPPVAAGPEPTEARALPRPVPCGPNDTAYLLFTSGSTGRPKAVPITHANMAYFLALNLHRYALTPADICSQTFDCTFDLAMFDLFVTWAAGATLVSTPPQAFLALPDFIAREAMTVWFSVPSAIGLVRRRGGLSGESLPGLRWSLFCGEALAMADAQQWQAAAPNSIVENLYGPTELTIACTAYRWDPQRSPSLCVNGLVPIGPLYPTLRSILVDDGGNLADDEGELCVSGPQMFPGYLDQEDNAGRFLTIDEARWYRTGDIVRRNSGAGFCYLGRVDHQVKIRGYRVELAELEWRARTIPGVEEAVIVAVSGHSSRRLFAWYVGEHGAAPRILERLSSAVPEFMVPHWIKRLDEFPLSPNRKVDRRALAAMAQQVVQDAADGRRAD